MTISNTCPSLRRLQDFVLGRVSEFETRDVIQHLASCELCSSRLADIEVDDALIHAARKAFSARSDSHTARTNAQLDRLLKNLGLTPDGPDSATDDTPELSTHDWHRIIEPPRSDEELGRIGRYRLLEIVGRGGMGAILRAEDEVLNRLAAIKIVLPRNRFSESACLKFLQEARALSAVEHDNVVPVYEAATSHGVPWMAMRWLTGQTLEQRISDATMLPLAEVIRIAIEIAEGLAAAHAVGLVHRDIKPSNIWLDAKQNGRVRLIDFGLAYSTDARVPSSLPGGIVVGTPAYLAPEQARGEDLDARTDLFSLGCLLYRLCTGRVPFEARDALSTLIALTSVNPTPPNTLNKKIPDPFSSLILNLLAKDPSARPQSAADVVSRLKLLIPRTEPDGTQAELAPAAQPRASPTTPPLTD